MNCTSSLVAFSTHFVVHRRQIRRSWPHLLHMHMKWSINETQVINTHHKLLNIFGVYTKKKRRFSLDGGQKKKAVTFFFWLTRDFIVSVFFFHPASICPFSFLFFFWMCIFKTKKKRNSNGHDALHAFSGCGISSRKLCPYRWGKKKFFRLMFLFCWSCFCIR